MKLHWLVFLVMFGIGCSTSTTTSPSDVEDDGESSMEQTLEPEVVTKSDAADTVEVEVEAQEPEPFAVGDAAPGLQVNQWVAGEPLETLEDGRLYVVEFWATWCGPCLMSMPHVSELQEKYHDDVTFIGITDENEETVTNFLDKSSIQDPSKTWSEIVKYRLAIDQEDFMHNGYLRASGARGIPTAYIVGKKGRLLWTGHPMRIDGPLESIVSGDWHDDNAIAKSEEHQATIASLKEQLRSAIMAQRNEEWDEALTILDAIESDESLAGLVGDLRRQRLDLLVAAKRIEAALELARSFEEEAWNNPNLLNEYAWKLVSELPDDEASLDLAMKFVNRASELTDESEPPILDTLARVCYERGELDAAIQWQRKAVDLLDEAMRERQPNYQEALDEYLIERAKLNDDGNEESSEDDAEDDAQDESDESTEDVTAAT